MEAKKTTKDFTAANSNAEYTYISSTEVMLATPRKDGTLLEYFNFSAKNPTIKFVLDTGAAKMEMGTVNMADVPDDKLHHVGMAQMALRQLGGDSFGIRAAVESRTKAPKR